MKRKILIGVCVMLVMSVFVPMCASAAGEGAWIGNNTSSAGASSSGGTPCSQLSQSDPALKYREDCTGGSWIFYESVKETGETTFAPVKYIYKGGNRLGDTITIPGTCSEHEHGGFWHYGINALSGHDGNGFATWLGLPSTYYNYNFAFSKGEWGHWATLGYGVISYVRDQPKSDIFHEIKDENGDVIYRASSTIYDADGNARNIGGAVAGDNPYLLEAYKMALKYSGQDDNVSGIARGTYAFCWWPGMEDTTETIYYGQSNVGANIEGTSAVDSAGTGKVSNRTSAEYKLDAYIDEATNKTSVINIRFSHNPYANKAVDSVAWSVRNDASLTSGAGYSISKSTAESDSWRVASPSALTVPEGAYYAASNRKNGYVERDVYKVVFTAVGTYRFCEYLSVSDKGELTSVCAVITVKKNSDGGSSSGGGTGGGGTGGGGSDPTSLGTCAQFTAPTSYTNSNSVIGGKQTATTSVVAHIKNLSLSDRSNFGSYSASNSYRNWIAGGTTATEVYARPSDTIAWINCYYPGVQYMYNYEYASNDNGHGTACSDNKVGEAAMSGLYSGWTNNFKVTSTTNSSVNKIFNAPRTVLTDSNFSAVGTYGSGNMTWTLNANGTNGVTDTKSTVNTYTTKLTNDAGKFYQETIFTPGTPYTASLSYSNHSWTQPCCVPDCCSAFFGCTCCSYPTRRHTNNFNDKGYNYATDQSVTGSSTGLSSSAQVKIPYNYINTTGIGFRINKSAPVYAGESVEVTDAWVKVSTRDNYTTAANYATQVDNAQVTMISYVTTSTQMRNNSAIFSTNSGNTINANPRTVDGAASSNVCDLISERKNGDNTWCTEAEDTGSVVLNENGNLSGASYNVNGSNNGNIKGKTFATTYNVYDAPAGDYYCMAMAVFPASSGVVGDTGANGDKNMSAAGDSKWYISAPECRIIAKRPSIQILGGDLYVGGSAQTSVSTKQQLYRVSGYGYLPTSRSSVVVNGSWVEEGIVAAGKVSGLSSGASLGYVNGNSRISGGLNYTKFCETRVPLSIANYTTVSNELRDGICPKYDFIGSSGIQSVVKNRAALANYWGSGTDATNIYIGDDSGKAIPSATGKDIRVVESGSNVTIRGGALYSNMMRVVKTTEGVTINGNIENDGDGMTSSGEVPKAVIYAKNIYISCYVRRIDAVLIAENKIVTCIGYEGNSNINSAARSNQLIINGVVIANKIDFGRTFGNSVGNGSGEPAEIINYDTTTLLWGRYMAGSAESDTLTVTYQHELAPRY